MNLYMVEWDNTTLTKFRTDRFGIETSSYVVAKNAGEVEQIIIDEYNKMKIKLPVVISIELIASSDPGLSFNNLVVADCCECNCGEITGSRKLKPAQKNGYVSLDA
jgi:hypothetical protein